MVVVMLVVVVVMMRMRMMMTMMMMMTSICILLNLAQSTAQDTNINNISPNFQQPKKNINWHI